MITLITGGPGTGKTAWIVNQLVEIQATQKFRSLYIHGIRDLKIPHTVIYCKSELCDLCRSYGELPEDVLYVEDWPTWKKTYDLIVVDEFQRVWRASSGGKIHESIAMLDTHRHYGIDFWLITQSPKLVHTNVKAMVGRHIHLMAKWSGRTEYEWSECQDNVTSRSGAVTRSYKLPKKVYSLYKSAELHTKQDKRKPMAFYIFILIVPLSIAGITYSVHRVNERTKPVLVSSSGAGAGATLGAADSAPNVKSDLDTYLDFKPKIDGVPESAPAYKDLLKVVSAPTLLTCIKSETKCKCYTAQATIYQTTIEYCTSVVNSLRFNPYVVSLPLSLPSQQSFSSYNQHEAKL